MNFKIFFVLALLIHTNSIRSQSQNELATPQFSYQQIEEIKKGFVAELKGQKVDKIIIFTKWFIGSVVEATSENEGYRNHFDIYILWVDSNSKYKSIQFDNFGAKEYEHRKIKKGFKFLKTNLSKMETEELSPKKAVIEVDGKLVEIAAMFGDHELEYQIDIFYDNRELSYKYLPSWKNNEANLETKQFEFLNIWE